MELIKARTIAIEICYKLQPFTDKLNIAGSIRRKKSVVKDIEICCVPKQTIVDSEDLFGTKLSGNHIDIGFLTVVDSLGTVQKGSATGRYAKIELFEGINLDLFMPDPADYFRQYAIRTGSADYSFKVIASGWRQLGWVGTDLGLRLEKDCIESKLPGGKSKWTCIRNKNKLPPTWKSEEEFFQWLKVPYVKPEFRSA